MKLKICCKTVGASRSTAGFSGRINICMNTYLIPLATCVETAQTIKQVDLAHRFSLTQRSQAQTVADQLAVRMQNRMGGTWRGHVTSYTIDNQKRTRL